MSDIIEELKQKRKKIEQLRRDQANQEGQENQLLKQLKDEIGVNSTEEAEEEIEKLGTELVENEKILEKLDREMDTIISAATSRSNSTSE